MEQASKWASLSHAHRILGGWGVLRIFCVWTVSAELRVSWTLEQTLSNQWHRIFQIQPSSEDRKWYHTESCDVFPVCVQDSCVMLNNVADALGLNICLRSSTVTYLRKLICASNKKKTWGKKLTFIWGFWFYVIIFVLWTPGFGRTGLPQLSDEQIFAVLLLLSVGRTTNIQTTEHSSFVH